MPPSKYYGFPEELVIIDGIKTLGLHLRATCRKRNVAYFRLDCFRLHITRYTGSFIFYKSILFSFGNHNMVKMSVVVMRNIVSNSVILRLTWFFINNVVVMKVLFFCN